MTNLCLATILINLTSFPWNSHDKETLERARQTCKTDIRYADTPCLKRFVKTGERDYRAICGVADDLRKLQ